MRRPGPARRRRSAGLSLAIVGLAAAAPALAAPKPAQLTATFNDRDGPKGKVGEQASGCTVNFAEIVDERRSPEMVGVIERRAVRAPADVQAWMRAVLGGLPARGVDVSFDAAPAPGAKPARFTLQTAWIQSTVVTYSASVVVRLQAEGAAERSYRGRVARTAYWSGGTGTLQSAVDGAFADALDEMAVDLKA
ncbi:MAG TPA: hypothetical protein VEA60_06195, partial [Allosphingosinicella sp.]|nr:hypothetical protein [Allosphingosinicella sp.]